MSSGHPNDEVRVAIDGSFVHGAAASVSVFDRGFLYGDSVFETMRTYGGRLFRLPEHLERLAWSASKLAFDLPLTVSDLVGEVSALVASVHESSPATELVARLMITRGEGPIGLDPSFASGSRRVLFIQPLKPLPSSVYADGVDVISVSTFRPSDAALGAKVGNYLESILALQQARARGAHEALILAYDGHVIEGTTSNVFAIRGDRLLTPPRTETLLPGITRALVMAAAPAVGLHALEMRMAPADLAGADELFLTSTVREIVPVVRIDGHPIADAIPGPQTRALHRAFREREGFSTTMPWE